MEIRGGCWLTKQAEQIAEQQRAGAEGAGKGKEKALPECTWCERRGFECERGSGKSTACKACIEAKAKCVRPGAEGSEKATKRRRKAEEESPRGKKKRARTTEESEAGPSKVRGTEREGGAEMAEGVMDVLGEIRDAMRAQNRRLDHLNVVLGRLVELKAKEVYGGGTESEESEAGEEEVREVQRDLTEIAMEETEQGHGDMEEG